MSGSIENEAAKPNPALAPLIMYLDMVAQRSGIFTADDRNDRGRWPYNDQSWRNVARRCILGTGSRAHLHTARLSERLGQATAQEDAWSIMTRD